MTPPPAPIDVRPFARRELNRIVQIEGASFGKDAWPAECFVDYWRESPELFLTARLGRRIAGYSITRTNWRGAELESIAAGLALIGGEDDLGQWCRRLPT